MTGKEELDPAESGIAAGLSRLQEKTSLLPDYGFKPPEPEEAAAEPEPEESWPQVSLGSSVSGVVGSMVVLALVAALGLVLVRLRGARPT